MHVIAPNTKFFPSTYGDHSLGVITYKSPYDFNKLFTNNMLKMNTIEKCIVVLKVWNLDFVIMVMQNKCDEESPSYFKCF